MTTRTQRTMNMCAMMDGMQMMFGFSMDMCFSHLADDRRMRMHR